MFWSVISLKNTAKPIKPIGILFIFLLTFVLIYDRDDNQAYATDYKTVYVNSGDSLWSIASTYTSEREDIRTFVLLVKKINHLNDNAQIYPGQTLKIPITTYKSN